ncbi:MAG: M28 family peptidase [Bacteroidales bacterium]|nr:M28 family peptidase [Bacteroidales bacterium]
MKFLFALMMLLLANSVALPQNADSLLIRKIFDQAMTSRKAYDHLEQLCTQAPGRLFGSPNSLLALDLMKAAFEQMGADTIYLQPFHTPAWKCDSSSVYLIDSGEQISLHADALGPSPSTPAGGIEAEVIEVQSLDELETLGRKAIEGKIVFLNRKWDPTFIRTFEGYGDAVDQRAHGPEKAAAYGAIAAVVRSVTNSQDHFPHTGSTRFAGKKIPALAISTLDADLLSATLSNSPKARLRLNVASEDLPDILTYNLIAERKGREKPEEIIVLGSHIDTWFNTAGAHDDGAGVVMTSDVLRIFSALQIPNKRSLRIVVYMDEELYQSGGRAYLEAVMAKGEKHYLALESDGGAFTPRMFTVDASPEIVEKIARFQPFVGPYGIETIKAGWGGVDIGPLKTIQVPLMSYGTDSQRYFDLHHSANDRFDKINLRELQLGIGCISAVIYLIDKYGYE